MFSVFYVGPAKLYSGATPPKWRSSISDGIIIYQYKPKKTNNIGFALIIIKRDPLTHFVYSRSPPG